MKVITLTSSNFAKYTGHNQYEAKQKVINELLSKNGIKDVYVPKSNIEEQLMSLTKENLSALKQELQLPDTSNLSQIEAVIKSKIMASSYSKGISEEQSRTNLEKQTQGKPVLESLSTGIKHDLRMRRGNIKETMNINKIQKQMGVDIEQRNSKMYTKELYSNDLYTIMLRGKVDGLADGTIVESKNRTRRLFKTLREYGQVQLECYMFLTGFEKAVLTEHFNGTEFCIDYSHQQDFWDDCVQKAIQFIDTYIAPSLLKETD